ncbi:MAG: hypothetical protein HY909_05730 [Deltaproteobacteria bacterium]|nr:hypothetical protein [Deltaproteobacteria bacterium]
MNPEEVLQKLRGMLSHEDPAVVDQGHELLRALGDAQLYEAILEGTTHGVTTSYTGEADTLCPGAFFQSLHEDVRHRMAFQCLRVVLDAPPTIARAAALRERLKTLSFQEWKNLWPILDLSWFRSLPALEGLILDFPGEVRNLGALGALPTLKRLELGRARYTDDFNALAEARSLEVLVLRSSFRGLPGTPRELPRLRELVVDTAVREPWLLAGPLLASVTFRFQLAAKDLSWVARHPGLEVLDLAFAHELRSFSGIEAARDLEYFCAPARLLTTLEPLRGLTRLRHLSLLGLTAATDTDALRTLTGLTSVSFQHLERPSLPELQGRALTKCNLENAKSINDLTWLSASTELAEGFRPPWSMPSLPTLEGLGDTRITRLSFTSDALGSLGRLPVTLLELWLDHAPLLADLAGIEGCVNLQSLRIRRATALKDLSALRGLQVLRRVEIYDSVALEDVSVLGTLTGLEVVVLERCRDVRDVSALVGLPKLKGLGLTGSGVDRKALPEPLLPKTVWVPGDPLPALKKREGAPTSRLPRGAGGAVNAARKALRAALQGQTDALERALAHLRTLSDGAAWDALLQGLRWNPAGSSGAPGFECQGLFRVARHRNSLRDHVLLRVLALAPVACASATLLRTAVDDLCLRRATAPLDLACLQAFPNLRCLDLEALPALEGVERLARFGALRVLRLKNTPLRAVPPGLSLGALSLEGTGTEDLSALSALKTLRTLRLVDLPRVTPLGLVASLPITSLELSMAPGAPSVSLVGNSTISELALKVPSVSELPTGLRGLPLLRSLRLIDATPKILRRAVDGLSVRALHLEKPRELSELSALKDLTSLEHLTIAGCIALADLSALQALRSLRVVELLRCPRVRSLADLEALPALEKLRVTSADHQLRAVPPSLSAKTTLR